MLKKSVKQWSAVALALTLAFSAMTLPGAYAANAVDTKASCSIEFSVGGNYEELKAVDVPLNLYKVASINETGNYQSAGGFESLDLSSVKTGEGSADTWLKRAEEAAKLAEGKTPDANGIVQQGAARIDNLSTGLYLVMAKETDSDYYSYTFTPYLISLPNNYFETTGDDTWVYDLIGENAIGLKPEQEERFGSITIQKELLNQNITFGNKATFVFQLDITTPKGETETKLKALTFDSATSKSVVVDKIAAGSVVKVTEVYGSEEAGYKLTEDSAKEQTVTVVANETVQVSFRNEHDGKITGGYGVVNNFKLDENDQYNWNKLDDSAAQ